MAFKNINYVMPDEKKNRIMSLLGELHTEVIEFAVNLEPEDRRSMPMMGQKTFGFTDLCHGFAFKHQDLLASFQKPDEMKNDMDFTRQLRDVLDVLDPIYEKIQDTYMAVGAEAYLAARIFYKSVKNAAEMGVPGCDVIVKELGTIFKRPSRSKKEESSAQESHTEEKK